MRDLDVLLARLRERLSTFPAEDGAEAEPMLKALRTERRKARKRMVAVFDSTRYQALLAALETARPKSVVDGSAASAYRSLRASADGVGEHSPDDDLHALRVKGKRLRYAAEPVEGLGAVVKAAKDLQTLLGEHQDATVAESTVRRLLDPKTAFVAGRLVQAEHETKLRCRAQLAQALRAVEEAASAKLSH